MRNRRGVNCATFLLGLISTTVALVTEYPGNVSEAACPPVTSSGWPANATVYYQTVGFTDQEIGQIGGGGGLGSWNFHNIFPASQNCSNVYFSAAPPQGNTQ